MEKSKLQLRKAIKVLSNKLGENLISIVLFGSHATRLPRKYSDIDLLVIAKNLPADWREKNNLAMGLATEIENKINKTVDLVLLSPRELDNATLNLSPLILSIFERYAVLYGEDVIAEEKENLRKFFIIKKISKLAWQFKSKNV